MDVSRAVQSLGRSVVIAGGTVGLLFGSITQAAPQAIEPELVARTQQTLGLTGGEVMTLLIPDTPNVAITTVIALGEDRWTLELQPFSIRAAGYQLKAQIADGSYINVDPGPDRTLRGKAREVLGSMAAATLLDEGLFGTLMLPSGERIWFEPIHTRVPGALPGHYAIYKTNDVIPSGRLCGLNDNWLRQISRDEVDVAAGMEGQGKPGEGGVAGSTLYITQLACDADVEYFQDYGSVIAVQNRITSVINTVNVQYENQCDIRHVLTTILVRTAEPDPYSSTSSGTLLSQFRNHWMNEQGAIIRDVAHLFTGKNLQGGTIGQAWQIGSICSNSTSYCHAESDCCSTFACATDLSAHELGHLWNAVHCSCSSPAFTMNPSITCINSHNAATISTIIAYRNTRTCLDLVGQPPSAPVTPSPVNGATNVPIDADLGWNGGLGATSFDVYFGTNSVPGAGELVGNTASSFWILPPLNPGTLYFWQIVAKNDSGSTPGPVWNFTTIGGASCPADINNSGSVGPDDLGILLGSWGNPGCNGSQPCPANLNGQGGVDAADLGILLGSWGPC